MPSEAEQRRRRVRSQCHGSSPLRKAAAAGGGRSGRRSGRRAGRQRSRPRLEVDHARASRLAWPRLWVLITRVTPSSAEPLDQRLDLALGARVQAGGGLVEEQDVGLQRPGARQRQPLLLAAGQRARRRGRPARPGRRAAAPAAQRAARSRARHAAQPQRQQHVAAHRQAAAGRAAGTASPPPAAGPSGAVLACGPAPAPGRAAGAAASSCRRRWRRPARAGRRGAASGRRRAAPCTAPKCTCAPSSVSSGAPARRRGRRVGSVSRFMPAPRAAARRRRARCSARDQQVDQRRPHPAARGPAPAPAAGRPCWSPARSRSSSRA